ncbi:PREDICTED: protein FAM214B [Cercocebus atys]|uniref:protein FAM214B n=1 Tax=Cercocebus atys TaxID=9531 RepID=UPI0005F4AD42|nr:PREDICTED: protein FAM214B [Cercocebus atys]
MVHRSEAHTPLALDLRPLPHQNEAASLAGEKPRCQLWEERGASPPEAARGSLGQPLLPTVLMPKPHPSGSNLLAWAQRACFGSRNLSRHTEEREDTRAEAPGVVGKVGVSPRTMSRESQTYSSHPLLAMFFFLFTRSPLRSLRKGPGLLSPPSASPVPTPAVSRTLLGNFEESLLRGRFAPSGHIEGFTAEIGASGSYCPQHVTLPVTVTFFDVSEQNAPAPFLGIVDLNPLGRKGYSVPKVGTIQVTLFNPNQTVVKMFLVTFDFSDMPAAHMTFLRHRLFLVPVGEEGNANPTHRLLCYLLHLRFRSSRSGRLSLHGDIRLLFSRRSLELDTGLPYELQAVTEAPHNPRYSPLP